MVNSRVPKNRQTENLGDFDGFKPFRMRTFQILRFAKKVIIPCNSTSKQGKKKAEWRVTIRRIDKKMVEDFSNRKTSNAKSEILNFATNHTGVLRFLITYCFRVTGLLSLLNFVEYHLYKITQNQF